MKHSTKPQPRVFGPMLPYPSRWSLYALTALLVATGSAWLIAHYGRPDDTLPSPIEPWSMKVHGAAAMATIFALGTILHRHLLPGWRMQRNRIAGISMCIALGSLVVTGYGLYYFDGDTLRWIAQRLHWGVGFALPIVFAGHVAAARRLHRPPPKRGMTFRETE